MSGWPELLDKWIEETEHYPCSQLRSAARGISQDIKAARNAVRPMHSNGIAERNNSKIRQTMHVCCGHRNFETLKARILLQDIRRHSAA